MGFRFCVSALRMFGLTRIRVYVALATKLKKKINVQILWLQKVNYKKWKIPVIIISVIMAVSLISLLVVVPLAYGDHFVSFSFRLLPFVGSFSGYPAIEVVYFNGSLIKVGYIGLEVNVSNSYLMPVQVHYNGFDYVMIVYNHTVTDPSDVVSNKPFLVWGAFLNRDPTIALSFSSRWVGGDPYNYYVTRRSLSNYTVTIRPGTSWNWVFADETTWPTWGGQDLNGNRVLPGIYYIYCIVYGKTTEPISLNITSILPPPSP